MKTKFNNFKVISFIFILTLVIISFSQESFAGWTVNVTSSLVGGERNIKVGETFEIVWSGFNYAGCSNTHPNFDYTIDYSKAILQKVEFYTSGGYWGGFEVHAKFKALTKGNTIVTLNYQAKRYYTTIQAQGSDSHSVNIIQPVTGIKISSSNPLTIYAGPEYATYVNASVLPSDAYNKNITWGTSTSSTSMSIESKFSTSSFSNNYSVYKDMYSSSSGYYWSDGGSDAFDGWGYFQIQNTNGSVKTNIPLENPNGPDGSTYTKVFTHNGASWQVKYGWATNGIFRFEIKQISGTPQEFKLYFRGNYGSDGRTYYGDVLKEWVSNMGGTHRLYTHWNNDGSKDSTGGDPQITYTIVPYNVSLQTITSPKPYTSSYSGDYEEVSTVNLIRGVTVYVQWGYTTVDAVQTWIINDLKVNLPTDTNTNVIKVTKITDTGTAKVEGVKIGTETLTATSEDGGYTQTITVNVVKAVELRNGSVNSVAGQYAPGSRITITGNSAKAYNIPYAAYVGYATYTINGGTGVGSITWDTTQFTPTSDTWSLSGTVGDVTQVGTRTYTLTATYGTPPNDVSQTFNVTINLIPSIIGDPDPETGYSVKHSVIVLEYSDIAVSSGDISQYLTEEEKAELKQRAENKYFVDGDVVKSAVVFMVENYNLVNTTAVDLQFNTNNKYGIEIQLNEAKLYKLVNGQLTFVKDGVISNNGTNKYTVNLGTALNNGDGKYVLRYKGRLLVETANNPTIETITNKSTLKFTLNGGGTVIEGTNNAVKLFDVNMKVYTGRAQTQ